MADITILSPDCDDDDDGDDERGKRGKRGKRGHTGPPGPAGSASGGLLKFSGVIAPAGEGPVASYLEDWGVGVGIGGIIDTAPSYPVAVAHSLVNMATNLLGGVVVPGGGTITFDLVKNLATVPVVIATIVYGAGDSGIKSVLFGPTPFAIGDTFDLRVTTTGTVEVAIDASATVGVE
jgi:hypothetical protein